MVVVEACVTSVAEAVASVRAGAHRLELCVDLEVGGLTPGVELLGAVVEAAGAPVFTMVRPRPGPFRVPPTEIDRMAATVATLRAAGARGIVLGVLDADGGIDGPALSTLVAAARPLPVTFHRAFDEVGDAEAALETLLEMGVARVLTGGGPGRAWDQRDRLAELVRAAADRLTVLAGGGVRDNHVVELVAATGVREVHARAAGIPGVVQALQRGAPGRV